MQLTRKDTFNYRERYIIFALIVLLPNNYLHSLHHVFREMTLVILRADNNHTTYNTLHQLQSISMLLQYYISNTSKVYYVSFSVIMKAPQFLCNFIKGRICSIIADIFSVVLVVTVASVGGVRLTNDVTMGHWWDPGHWAGAGGGGDIWTNGAHYRTMEFVPSPPSGCCCCYISRDHVNEKFSQCPENTNTPN